MNVKVFSFLAAMLMVTVTFAAEIEVKSAWVRATVTAQMTSGAFLEITSKTNATLVGVSSPVADEAEVHEMKMENGVMKMRHAPRVALPAGKAVIFNPGGYHIMLMGLKRQLNPGDVVPVSLKIERADKKLREVVVNAKVRALTE